MKTNLADIAATVKSYFCIFALVVLLRGLGQLKHCCKIGTLFDAL
jgi:hypothetical protein